jgi:transketolase
MLNNKLKLNPKIFDADVEQVPIRNGFGEGLLFLGDHNANVVALSADLTESTRTEAFAKKFPDRSFEVGVAEQNMATIAAGLGVSGKVPFIASYATFSPGRNYEQIRTTIAYNDSNVKIAGHHAGVSVGPDGATHQATEDIAIMRAMPNMLVFVPCDAIEAKKATIAAAAIDSPVYIRFAREKSAVVTTEETPFTPGKIDVFWESRKPQVAIIACGLLMRNALLAAKELEKEKIGVLVLNNHSVKPMDEKAIVKAAERTGAVVTVEEHQIAGGMGSAVAEILAKHHPTPIEFVGMRDTFGESGPPEALIEKYGMGVKDIKEAVRRAIGRK